MNKTRTILLALIASVVFSIGYLYWGGKFAGNDKIYYCQVGIYKQKANAESMIENLKGKGYQGYYFEKEKLFYVISEASVKKVDVVNIGKKLSKDGYTCVVKEAKVSKDYQEAIKKKHYDELLEELS